MDESACRTCQSIHTTSVKCVSCQNREQVQAIVDRNKLLVNQPFWAEINPLQYHIREQCAVHSAYGEATRLGSTGDWVAKLVLGNVTVWLDEVNALRVAQALTSAAIQSNKLDGQY